MLGTVGETVERDCLPTTLITYTTQNSGWSLWFGQVWVQDCYIPLHFCRTWTLQRDDEDH